MMDSRTHTLDPGPIGTLHELLERQAAKTPEATALIDGIRILSYRDLDHAANAFAHRIVSELSRPGLLVGVYAEHSAEMVIATLGVLKAGAVFVPLDRRWPSDRIADIIRAAALEYIVVQTGLAAGGNDVREALRTVSRVDDPESIVRTRLQTIPLEASDFLARRPQKPVCPIATTDRACVFFTSGSTGVPKGVVQTHTDCLDGQMGALELMGIDHSDRVLLRSPFSTSGILCEMLWPLASGGAIVVAPDRQHADPRGLAALIRRHEVTVLSVVPTFLRVLLEEPAFRTCDSLGVLLAAGEPLPISVQEVFFNHLSARLCVIYGSTEAPSATFRWCYQGEASRAFNIGRVVGSKELYILDKKGKPVPDGETGELCIAGPGVASGYLNDPVQTLEKFPDPPGKDGAGYRMYRTGDLARVDANGDLEYRGRADEQIKVRGFRVEPAEIEARLAEHGSVLRSVVLLAPASSAASGESEVSETAWAGKLVAFVEAGNAVPPAALRRHLATRMPGYMIPEQILIVNSIPLLSSGKVDRRGLLAFLNPQTEGGSGTPGTRMEEELLEIWREVFEDRGIDRHDDFFECGGHSLLALSMNRLVEQRLGRYLPLASVIDHPTPAAMAVFLESGGEGQAPADLIALQSVGDRSPLFLVPGAGGGLLRFTALAKCFESERPVYGFTTPTDTGRADLSFSVPDLARHHIRVMRRTQPAGPYFLSGYSFGGLVAHEMAVQLEESGDEIGMLAILDAFPATTLSHLPPFIRFGRQVRTRLIRTIRLTGNMLQSPVTMVKGRHLRRSYEIGMQEFARNLATELSEDDRTEESRISHDKIIAANRMATATYRPKRFSGNTLFVRARENTGRPEYYFRSWSLYKWSDFTENLEIVTVVGNHHTFLRPPHVESLARILLCRMELEEST